MITRHELIDIVFRYSIFSLLIYKIYDLSKKYFVPYLNELIILQAKEHNDVLEKEELIASTCLRVENQIMRQKQLFVILEKNVQQWHTAMLTLKNQAQSEQRRLTQSLQEKRHKQQELVVAQKNIYASLPQALEQAHEELTQKYAGAQGKKYLEHMLSLLNTKNQCS